MSSSDTRLVKSTRSPTRIATRPRSIFSVPTGGVATLAPSLAKPLRAPVQSLLCNRDGRPMHDRSAPTAQVRVARATVAVLWR